MLLFRNMKIKWKLAFSFGAVLFLTLFVGVFSLIKLNGVTHQAGAIGGLLERYSNRTAILHDSILWGYPVFKESEALGMYLQSENLNEQKALFVKFEEYGKEFSRIGDKLKKRDTSPEEKRLIQDIEDMQKNVLSDAVNLITIRDGEGTYGPETKVALLSFQKSLNGFALPLERLVSIENQQMRNIYDESKVVSAGIEGMVGSAAKIMVLVVVIAVIIGALVSFRLASVISSNVNKTVSFTSDVASGDLTKKLAVASNDEVGRISIAFNEMVDNFHEVICKIKSSVNLLSSSSIKLSESANQISGGSNSQSLKTDQIASAAQEMTATIAGISQNSSGVSEAAKIASDLAAKGGKIVSKTVESMRSIADKTNESSRMVSSLEERSKGISKIINVVNEIADQTNLLALNAAIEAARAGDHGRGFAVVASEVGKLAENTKKATGEISFEIKAIQDEINKALSTIEHEVKLVKEGVGHAQEGGAALGEIVEQVEKVSSMIGQIARAAEEQSSTTNMISDDIVALAEISRDASKDALYIISVSEEINQLARDLRNASSIFKIISQAQHGSTAIAAQGYAAGPREIPS